ncbi:ladderlectin-like [Clupea harengus]|uniref:Ladderlectin-like n=1 Tax=Clupea harengus TaxID=7950 RepID=A0A8M1KUU5_CLUHA|nr:ladderlectin-like [Clupea harengus]
MATEAMTDGDPGETEVQLPDSSEAMTVGDPGETEVQFSDSSEVKAVEKRASCGQGWTGCGNRCFRFFSFGRTWSLAEGYCVSQRGHLASIHNIKEARLVGRLSRNKGLTWIGGGGSAEGFTWYWTDGSAFDYSNWGAWEPNNGSGNEHCININYKGEGVWNDLPCHQSRPFVCAK